MLVIQSEPFLGSRLATLTGAVVTSNTALAGMPGNVFLPATATGLAKDSAVNVTALVTLDRDDLIELGGVVPGYLMDDVDRGLRLALGL